LKISNHAQKRLDQRGFSLAGEDMSNLSQAMDELDDKGSKNSLLFYKDMALDRKHRQPHDHYRIESK
jgi:hypothetical protein